MPAPLAPFSLPDRYRLEGGIAAGGMAAVYAAHDTLLDRPVAVKVLAEHLNSDETARKRFQREARAAAGLSSHPGVVTIFDVGEHEGRSFMVMEHRTGGTIGEQLAEHGAIEPGRALGWLHTAAEALDAAHERGVVHRDIKPGNLLLDEHDRVAVADFGIARLALESDRFTQTGQVLGTAAYISPEQAVGDPATAASDRYALAVVAFELLTGDKPYPGSHFAAQARAHIEDPVPSARAINPALAPAVDEVLARGLAKDPADRFPSARAFTDALEHAVAASPPEPTEPTKPIAAAAAAPPSTPPSRPAAPAAGRPGRRGLPAPVVAALLLLLVAGAALAIALGSGGGGEQTATQEPEPTATERDGRDAESEPEPTAEAEQTATGETAEEAPADEPSGSIQSLHDEGFALFEAGDYAGAVPFFRQAVEQCGGSTELICAYSTYNLGASLNRSGNPSEAIPILQRRLERWPQDQPDVVRAELADACANAGADCGETGGPGNGRGKAKGKGKGKDR